MTRGLRIACVIVVAAGIAALLAWAARRPLSDAVVATWLDDRAVASSYRVVSVSPSAITLADVALGTPARPDFVAERVEAKLAWSLFSPRLVAVTMLRPVLRVSLTNGKLSFGELDRLLPTSRTTRLPDIYLGLAGARLELATSVGRFSAHIDGRGQLSDGFTGHGSVAPTMIKGRGCVARLHAVPFDVATQRSGSRIAASGRLQQVSCQRNFAVTTVDWRVSAAAPSTFDTYRADISAHAERLHAGRYGADALDATASVGLTPPGGPLAGPLRAVLTGGRLADAGFRRLELDGRYRYDARGGNSIDATADLTGGSVRVSMAAIDSIARRSAGTFAEPLIEQAARQLSTAAGGFNAMARVAADGTFSTPAIEIRDLALKSASGVLLRQSGSIRLTPDERAVAGSFDLSGGGLPPSQLTAYVSQQRVVAGEARLTIGSYAAPGAVLHEAKVDWRGDGWAGAVSADVSASGAIGAGITADRLAVKIAGRLDQTGAVEVAAPCLSIGWQRVRRGALLLDPALVRLCPQGPGRVVLGGVAVPSVVTAAPTNLRGTYAGQPLELGLGIMRVVLAKAASGVQLAVDPATITARLGPRSAHGMVAGRFEPARGAGYGRLQSVDLIDPTLPVAVRNVALDWRIAGAGLWLANGSARVTDRSTPARFEPITVRGFAGRLANGNLTADGRAVLVSTASDLFRFAARHDLHAGKGSAALTTGKLTFGAALQPYQISERLRGIVANVVGPVEGSGQLDWRGSKLTSRGTLRIGGVALATAALGPVTGITGTLQFDDLLALTTPPGQVLRVATINPGILVEDGVANFQMLGPDAVAIAALRWPYAGGTLDLDPVTIRANEPRRKLVLTVRNLDAALFLQRFDFKNLRVTGRFDGRLPLVFAETKGRIVGGTLVARPGGGLLQYVGELGGKELGGGAKLAFDALRRLRYRDLSLDLDGDLDGELVTQVHFSGKSETAASLGNGRVPVRATGLPFKFNVAVRAPFRALLGTAASFTDVRPLIRPAAPATDKP